jgi:sialate O-acetylesterase
MDMKKFGLLGLAWAVSICTFADLRMPKIFGDNMVLQRNQPILIWGWSGPGEKITVQFNHQEMSVQATPGTQDNKWMVKLNPEQAGGPYELVVKGGNGIITFKNVLVGEVWVCSGQSNMEMPIEGWGRINHYQEEIAAADYEQIRHFKVPNTVSSTPAEDIKGGEWKICSPANAGDFTAVGYFFARELYERLHVPIGLINTSWGGTMVETWTSRTAFENSDEFKTMINSMPVFNIDSFASARRATALAKVALLQGALEKKEVTITWSGENIDDSKWKTMKIPGFWEGQGMGLEDLDGEVWFRKTVTLSKEDEGKEASLQLATIDDNDVSFVNGVRVGGTNGYAVPRKYIIPAGILKEGKNLIAVQVFDYGGGGGIYGDSANLKLSVGNHEFFLAGDWRFRIANVYTGSVSPNSYPTLLFNGMLYPLIPYTIKGAIWYQGETNAGRAYQYRKAFPLMITDWRNHWGEGDFPFYFVQLASFDASGGNSNKGSGWAELREAQTFTLSLPNTGMAITTDIGTPKDIHPKDKQDVGKRLAAIALSQQYGIKMEYSGPVYQSMKIIGDTIVLSFGHSGSGLMAKNNNGLLSGFEMAGEDQQFHPAKATIDGNQILVSVGGLAHPVAVRYAWADDAGEANLFNIDGFPAGSFRTDHWKGITEGNKYSIGN